MGRLSARAPAVWRIRLVAVWAVISFAGGLILFFQWVVGFVWLIVFSAAILYLLIYYIPAACKNVRFTQTEELLSLHSGVFIKKTVLIHRGRVQYAKLIQGPAARLYGTASLLFYLAGSVLWLSELERADAQKLQEEFCHDTARVSPPADPSAVHAGKS